MNIKRVKYKMSKDDSWKVGYVIGKYDGDLRTLLDENFEYVPKIIDNGEEYLVYDLENDLDKYLNMSIPM